MPHIKLTLFEIKKKLTLSATALIFLSAAVLFLYSLSFGGVVYSDGSLYELLRGYEKTAGERDTLLGSDAETALKEFYNAHVDLTPSANGSFFVEGDKAGMSIEKFFRHEQYFFEDSHDPETKKAIKESSSLFTANLMESFHWTMFWTAVFVLTAVSLLCAFIGKKETVERIGVIDSTHHGKESARIGFSAAMVCTAAVVAAGILYAVLREVPAISSGATAENIYGRYAFDLVYNTGSMSFGVYIALATVAFALFVFACAAFNCLIAVLLGGGTAVFAVVPAEILLQAFLAKLIFLNGFDLDWQLGGGTGFLFGGGGGRYETLNFKLLIPVLAACLALLIAGNMTVFMLKRKTKGWRK